MTSTSETGGTTTLAVAHFARPEVPTGRLGTEKYVELGAQGRLGYSVSSEALEERDILLKAVDEGFVNQHSFQTSGAEFVDARAFLAAENVVETAETSSSGDADSDSAGAGADHAVPPPDVALKEVRIRIGAAMTRFLREKFPDRVVVHVGDTSRVSGGASLEEATVRDTHSTKGVRAGHHCVHVDKWLPGIARCYGHDDDQGGEDQGGEVQLRSGAELWHRAFEKIQDQDDWRAKEVTEEKFAAAVLRGDALNFWVALTPGGITQQPLVLGLPSGVDTLETASGASTSSTASAASADSSSCSCQRSPPALVSNKETEDGVDPADRFVTLPVEFPGGILNDTLSLLRTPALAAEAYEWYWRPNMRFGEGYIFRTTETPHTAVYLKGIPDARRVSAEMRFVLL